MQFSAATTRVLQIFCHIYKLTTLVANLRLYHKILSNFSWFMCSGKSSIGKSLKSVK